MSSEYGYDEDGQLWPFFTLTMSSILAIPLTYRLVRGSSSVFDGAARIRTSVAHAHSATVEKVRARAGARDRPYGRYALTALTYAVAAYSVYLVHGMAVPEGKAIWNPYDILGLPDSATEKVIKKTYKTLSRKFHPDKIKPDASKNETVESLNDVYVEIGKAYQALTDETVRQNFLLYGHPDGKQSTSVKVALPQIIVSSEYGHYLVLLYCLFFIGLCYGVGSWWYGTLKRSKENVLMESANRLFIEYADKADEASVVAALSTGQEFEEVLAGDKADAGLATVEARITAPSATPDSALPASRVRTAAGLAPADCDKLAQLDNGVRRKTLALLWAHLGRTDLSADAALEQAKVELAPIANALVRSYTAIALAYGNTAPVMASIRTGQLFVQALAPKASPLLQLPHVTPAIAAAIESSDPANGAPYLSSLRPAMTVQRLMDLPDDKRRRLAVGPDRLSEAQYAEAVGVANQMPYLRVSKAFFKVEGEPHVSEGSLVVLVVKCRYIPPGYAGQAPPVDADDLLDRDAPELGPDEVAPRKPKANVGWNPDGSTIMSDRGDGKTYLPPLAHAPYYGRDHRSRWYVFLTDSKQGKIVVPPFTFFGFDRPVLKADGVTPTFYMQTLKAVFAAPPQAGQYTFVLHCISDSYVGLDTRMEITLLVRSTAELEAEAEASGVVGDVDDDISEPDEDSLAGMLSAAKGEPVKRATRAVRAGAVRAVDDESESDDESSTDDDAASASDTDTDTDGE